ncbi:replicative DNA helicase [Actinotalea sp. C106]|uniref:replicative DNA helicase n=1 Tax=Actinotalea sp. C106 TaxID=2908644 RepID=UPI0020296763
MSIDELEQGLGARRPEASFDRTPPQDVGAEQSVLGGMMLSKDAIADVVEQIKGTDFYKPAHELVYDAILDLYGRGEPADAVTVSAELTKRGEIGRIGGAPYLHTLISTVPTAANAGYYARIVRERAVLRRLVEAGTRIVQLGYATEGGDVDDLVNNAQAEIYAVTEQRTSEDYLPLAEIINGTMEEIEAAGQRGEGMIGVPTGFIELDKLTNGLHPGQMVVIAARPAMGKALALDTPLPTPQGWTTMGEVQVGDELLAADGTPTRVVAATEVQVGRPCYAVTFDDGTRIVADAEHEWFTDTRASRRARTAAGRGRRVTGGIRTTAEIAETLRCATAERRLNHSVPTAQALDLPEQDLPVDPYALGVWLGDGHSASARFTSDDPEIAMRIEGREDEVDGPGVEGRLRTLGVLNAKHIPTQYLRASERQRRELLAGLLDTDGTVNRTGSVQFTVTDQRLALDVRELVHSLGYRTGWALKAVRGRSVERSTAFILTFTTDDEVFALERKKLVHKERRRPSTARLTQRSIVAVEPVDSVPVRCVEIAHPEHLYLAGNAMVPTHNSTIGLDIVRSASIKHGLTSVVFSLEMSRNEITMRMLSAEARVPLQNMRKGTMRDEDWQKLASTMGKLSQAPLFIDDSPNMSLMEIRAKCRRLKQRHDLKLVVIDYLQLMSSGKRVESRQQEVSEFSRALKLLAKELEVPVIAISQLNRGAEQRTDKKPQMSDLRESGSIEQDADIVMLLHREDAYERESPRAGEADIIVAKHRNGPTDTIVVAFQGHYARFVDMAPSGM